MGHITTGVEYGLHRLLYLVDPPEKARPAIAGDLADLQGVPVEYVAKLFTQLQAAFMHMQEHLRLTKKDAYLPHGFFDAS